MSFSFLAYAFYLNVSTAVGLENLLKNVCLLHHLKHFTLTVLLRFSFLFKSHLYSFV